MIGNQNYLGQREADEDIEKQKVVLELPKMTKKFIESSVDIYKWGLARKWSQSGHKLWR